jgi:hypothetical protein
MMKRIFALLLVTAVFAFAMKAYTGQTSGRAFQILRHNVNQVECCVSNYGKFGQDETGNNAGCWWPIGTTHNYIYGAGSWFGTVDANGDTMVTIGYGPHGGESEYAPGRIGWIVSDPDAILWMYPTTWPPNTATLPMAPQTPKSHQDSWCVYNDGDIQYHIAGDTRPIGLEVYQTVYAWNLSTTQDIIFIRFECKNTTENTLTACYFGVCADNDIGNESGTSANDRISGIVGQWYVIDGDSTYIDNLGYQWQEVEEPGTPPWFPGTIGFDYLQSPWDLVPNADKDGDGILDQYERDSAYFYNVIGVMDSLFDADLDGTPDFRDPSQIPQLGMTAFKRFTLNLEPNVDFERYTTLAGYNFRTGVREPYDTVPPDPDDQRFLQCSGPFELEPESTAIVLVGIVFANWNGEFLRPDSALVEVDGTAQFIFDQNWLLPGPPPPPTVTLLPNDAQITLAWDNVAETTPDPYWDVVGTNPSSPLYDPYYRQYDFEGYRVWKSLSGQTGTWELLATCDLANDITINDTAFMPEPLVTPNAGIYHSFVDADVRNGFPYYYAVTAFDWNQVKVVDTSGTYPRDIWFESGLGGDSVRARREPVNYVAGSYTVTALSGNPALAEAVTASITSPLDMTTDDQYVDLGPIEYAAGEAQFSADLLDAAYTNVASMSVIVGSGLEVESDFTLYQGMNVVVRFTRPALTPTDVIFDSVGQVTGSYPVDSLVVATPMGGTGGYGFWSYRGNDYEVYWMPKDVGGLVNTVVVLDAMSGDTVPYAPFTENAATDSLANSWSFHSTPTGVSDTLVYDNPGPPPLGTKYLYICGGKVNLKNGLDLVTGDPRPEDGEVWHVYAGADLAPASAYGRMQVASTPAYFDQVAQELNVKVVPNPYIIWNEWQTQFVQRRLKFINLPNECTIRIFNLNGELVRTIVHSETSEGGISNNLGGDEWWDVLSENQQLVASGVYIYHIQSDIGEQVGKFVIVR